MNRTVESPFKMKTDNKENTESNRIIRTETNTPAVASKSALHAESSTKQQTPQNTVLKSNQTPIENIVSRSELDMFEKAKQKALVVMVRTSYIIRNALNILPGRLLDVLIF